MTFTKQWLQQTISGIEAIRDEIPFGLDEDESNTLEALKLALAALDTPHVGYLDAEYADLLKSGSVESFSVHAEPGEGCIAVYAAPPVPGVDADLLHIAALAIEDLMTNKDRTGEGVWYDVPERLRRAAMLQGAEPVQEWIPCSERMPENSDAVLVCQEGGIVFCAEFDGGKFYPDEFPNVPKQGREITHWMPLPAAPQQEVKS